MWGLVPRILLILCRWQGGAYSNGTSWIDISSREYKESIEVLSTEEALEAIKELHPVKYAYKADTSEKRVGFISEEVPELLAMKDRKGLSPMDILLWNSSLTIKQLEGKTFFS